MRRLTTMLALSVLLAGCQPAAEIMQPDVMLASGLRTFDACEDARAWFVRHGLQHVTAYGLPPSATSFWAGGVEALAARGEAAEAVPAVPGEDFSQTNTQEEGVDEPDIVKTDGRWLYVVHADELRIVDVSGAQPRPAGRMSLGHAGRHELLLHGDRLLVLSEPAYEIHGLATSPLPARASTVRVFDVSDPGAARLVSSLDVDGQILTARAVEGVTRVVVRSEATGLEFRLPEAGGVREQERALQTNRAVIRASSIDDWLPGYVYRRDGVTTQGRLVACSAVHHPREFSGLGVVSVLTLAPEGARIGDGGVAIAGSGETVYASVDRLYVATQPWNPPAARPVPLRSTDSPVALPSLTLPPIEPAPRAPDRTLLHAFDLTTDRSVAYLASGSVPGRLLSQWALDEHDGLLRVASTREGPRATSSMVTVLREDGQRLLQIGQVDGLGPDEQIHAVRFLDDLAYVVTFRETDPLYVVDLRDPQRPQVRGELKILGYSAYLHPLGDGRLLGVGQDADPTGRTQGTQLSLFDVSDPRDPRRLDALSLPGGYSEVEYDHRAFLYWEPAKLAVVPVQSMRDAGALGVGVAGDELRRLGTVETRLDAAPRRSLVIDDRLYTVTDGGVIVSDLGTLRTWSQLRF